MSWTTVRGHRPVGAGYCEGPIGDQKAALDEIGQKCSCGAAYDCEHIAAQVID